MATAYEAWQETRAHLAKEPDSTFLQRVEESLRPAALLDFLASFRGLNGSEEPLGCEPDEAEEFLKDLNELRAPNQYEIEQMRAELFNPAIGQVERLRKMNWTGDHTYGDALDDVVKVLLAVWERKPFPHLERFRCPSIRKGSPAEWRCELQLPHDGPHKVTDPLETWTDEQSVNPPKSYDEPADVCGEQKIPRPGVSYRCDRDKGHAGQHMDGEHEKAWNAEEPVKLTEQQLDKLAGEVFGTCRAMWNSHRCIGLSGHAGPHEADPKLTAGNAISWPEEYTTGLVCPSVSTGGSEHCVLPEGHADRHHGRGDAPLSWPNFWPSNSDPINRPQSSRCTSSIEYSAADKSLTLYCKFDAGHDGAHQAPSGEAWTDHMAEISAGYPPRTEKAEDTDGECGAERPGSLPAEVAACVRPKQHDGLHRDAAGMRWGR